MIDASGHQTIGLLNGAQGLCRLIDASGGHAMALLIASTRLGVD